MTSEARILPPDSRTVMSADGALAALPHPVVALGPDNTIVLANDAAEAFFKASRAVLIGMPIANIVPFGSPLLVLIDQVRERQATVSEYRVDVGTPRIAADGSGERLADIYVAPVADQPDIVVVMLQERSIAEKFDRQLTYRGAARSVTALAGMLAHEIKNPMSGIRGAAQLLESTVGENDRVLTQLIRDEVDRIVKLVDRMEIFTDERPAAREPVNIHAVLDRVSRLAQSGVASHIRVLTDYDPSLPPLEGDEDQLIQVFLNLIKNAAEAIGPDTGDGEILLTTAFRPGVRLSVPGSRKRVSLPLEICVRDNGPGVADDMLPHLFDPFVTTKSSGTGLGLAFVAKVVGNHGGIVECESQPRKTVFRVLMPVWTGASSAERAREA